MSASKTFNLAGMLFSNIIIRIRGRTRAFRGSGIKISVQQIHCRLQLTRLLTNTADQWLDELKLYIDNNLA